MERRLSTPAIRGARPEDLDAIERLENSAFESDRLSRRSLRYFLAAPTTEVPVAEDALGLAGYAMIGYRAGSAAGRLFSLAVQRDRARQGIGHALLRACEAATLRRGRTSVRLEVRADNVAAVALYEQAGYGPFGLYHDYYEDGATALRFEKSLAPSAERTP